MPGAAELCTAAAARGGSGLVSLSAPGCRPQTRSEVVQHPIPAGGFGAEALSDIGRFGALVIGPGLGREDDTLTAARECIGDATVPVVVDGDALFAASWSGDGAGPLLRDRELATVLTPHDGEFGFLTGDRPGDDRIAAARAAAAEFDSTVLLKGPTTIVASPGGRVLLVDRGDQRLATAGSGDVLAGLIGAALAAGVRTGVGRSCGGLAARRCRGAGSRARTARRRHHRPDPAGDRSALVSAPIRWAWAEIDLDADRTQHPRAARAHRTVGAVGCREGRWVRARCGRRGSHGDQRRCRRALCGASWRRASSCGAPVSMRRS